MTDAGTGLPATIRLASIAFAIHAALAIAQAVGAPFAVVGGNRARALAAAVGMMATAWGLWRGYLWAWWLAMATAGMLLLLWGSALFLVSRLSGDRPALPMAAPAGVLGAALLLAAIVLLAMPRSRAAIRARSA